MSDVVTSKSLTEKRTSTGKNSDLGYVYDLTVNVDYLTKSLTDLSVFINKTVADGSVINIGFMNYQSGDSTIRVNSDGIGDVSVHASELSRFITESQAGLRGE